MTDINWPDLIHAGIAQLRLKPVEFWALTPAELMLMLGQDGATPPMGRGGLSDLLKRFPDRSEHEEKERENG